ncbi:SPFH domain-containing protein [Salinicola avicenniae]|uniref:SPFH domain-containing protein n=1 Tax=Salinicola avicenniae TaxID=2916836 RepID=UPI002072EF6E|nr:MULTISPECIES: SPFH domain-containing protein [unclassified Salinicola]
MDIDYILVNLMRALPGLGNASLGTVGFMAAGAVAVVIFIALLAMLKAVIQVCPPNQVMVVQGSKTKTNGREYGFRVILGGTAIVIPFLNRAEFLDLSVLPINVRVEGVNSANGITVGADATACVGVDIEDTALLYTAVERMLGKSRAEIHDQIHQTMVGNFRGAMNRTTPLQAMGMVESVEKVNAGETPEEETISTDEGERARFRQDMLDDANEDLASFGFRVFSVSFQRIWDSSDYISSLATKAVAHKRQAVEIQEARLEAEAENAESDGRRRESIARSQADESIVEAEQNLGIAREESQARIDQAQKEAAAQIARAQSQAQVEVENAENELQTLRNQSEVTLKPEYEAQAAEIVAEGNDQAIRIRQGVRNRMLEQQAEMIGKAGRYGRIPMFVQGQLPHLFKAYHQNAKDIRLDNLTFMGDDADNGMNAAINRGPAGFVDFLDRFEQAFGIRVRDFTTAQHSAPSSTDNTAESN